MSWKVQHHLTPRTPASFFLTGEAIRNMTMKDFVKHAYFAIMFMDQYRPRLGVGVEPDGVPMIKYLHYEAEWDKEPTPEGYKKYTNQKLEDVRRELKK